LPRTPSQKIVTFARTSTPGSNVDLRCPACRAASPVRTPTTRRALVEHLDAAKPGEEVDAAASTRPASHFTNLLIEMM
jgi:hypothetical protein